MEVERETVDTVIENISCYVRPVEFTGDHKKDDNHYEYQVKRLYK